MEPCRIILYLSPFRFIFSLLNSPGMCVCLFPCLHWFCFVLLFVCSLLVGVPQYIHVQANGDEKHARKCYLAMEGRSGSAVMDGGNTWVGVGGEGAGGMRMHGFRRVWKLIWVVMDGSLSLLLFSLICVYDRVRLRVCVCLRLQAIQFAVEDT
jgi:hypothetical protein